MVRQARRASGLRLLLTDQQDGAMSTLMGIPPNNHTATTDDQTDAPEHEAEEVCLLHFQGHSKKLIPSFDAFVKGDTDAEVFVLP